MSSARAAGRALAGAGAPLLRAGAGAPLGSGGALRCAGSEAGGRGMIDGAADGSVGGAASLTGASAALGSTAGFDAGLASAGLASAGLASAGLASAGLASAGLAAAALASGCATCVTWPSTRASNWPSRRAMNIALCCSFMSCRTVSVRPSEPTCSA
ncbi:MAG: hypothetical protein KC657_13940 [Myxococcales bacterium]|nr:hypothetical protein [Myxococcales bacterium]